MALPSAYISQLTNPFVLAAYGNYYAVNAGGGGAGAVFGNLNLMGNYANDAAAAAAGVQIDQAYLNGNFVMVRLA